jgi:hypothetical protein
MLTPTAKADFQGGVALIQIYIKKLEKFNIQIQLITVITITYIRNITFTKHKVIK